MAVEVYVERLLGGFQHQVTIRATVQMTRNHGGNARRKAPFQVFANQADCLPASHGCPQRNYAPVNT